MKKAIRLLAFAFSALFVLLLLPPPPVRALEAPDMTGVRAAVLYNVENDELLIDKNGSEAVYPASCVKLMTAVLAYRALRDRMGESVTVPSSAVNVPGYRVGLLPDERVTIEALFYAMLLRGANDAAHMLAIAASGSVSAFVESMNSYAAELGMKNTLYLNPSGMHEALMVTTACDTLLAARQFAAEEELLAMSSVVKYVLPATNKNKEKTIYNKNYIVSRFQETKYYYEYARGMNYGSTDEAGSVASSVAVKGGLTYIAVVLGGEENPQENTDFALKVTGTLLRYGVDSYAYKDVVNTETPVCELPVTLSSEADFVMLLPEKGLTVYLPADVDVAAEITYSYRLSYRSLEAPVEKGTAAGYLNVYYGERLLGTVGLVTGDKVERNYFLYLLDIIKQYTHGRFFAATAVSLVVFTAAYILISAAVRRKRQRRGMRYRF